MDKELKQLMSKFHQMFHEIQEVETHVMRFGTDTVLTREEVHLIQMIQDYPGSHVIGLSKVLGITKAAVSSRLMRLEKKGMITKTKDVSNQSRLIIGLTKNGQIAYEGHERFHKEFHNTMAKIFEDYSKEEMIFLLEFAERSKNFLKMFNEKEKEKEK